VDTVVTAGVTPAWSVHAQLPGPESGLLIAARGQRNGGKQGRCN